MKHKTLSIMALFLTTALLFTGCGSSGTSSAQNDQNSAASETTTDETASESDAADSKTADTADFDNVFSSMSTTDLDGNPVDASVFQENKLTLVNAWNIGCTPCIQEIPDLAKLSEEYAGKGVSIMGLYFNFAETIQDDEMSQIQDVLTDANATYPQLCLNEEMYATDTMQNVMAFPSTFLVDSNGKILDKLEGSNDYDGWKAVIEQYLTQID